MSKVVRIFVKFWHFFYDARSPNMVMSREANFENFLFCPNSAFNIRKSHKSSSRKDFYSRSYQLSVISYLKLSSYQPKNLIENLSAFKVESKWIFSNYTK